MQIVSNRVDFLDNSVLDVRMYAFGFDNVHTRNEVFVNALIENPAFDSQTKDTLTTKQSKFGSKCEVRICNCFD